MATLNGKASTCLWPHFSRLCEIRKWLCLQQNTGHRFDCVCAYNVLLGALSYIQSKCLLWGKYYKLKGGGLPFLGCASTYSAPIGINLCRLSPRWLFLQKTVRLFTVSTPCCVVDKTFTAAHQSPLGHSNHEVDLLQWRRFTSHPKSFFSSNWLVRWSETTKYVIWTALNQPVRTEEDTVPSSVMERHRICEWERDKPVES